MLWQVFQFIVLYSFFAMCNLIENDFNDSSENNNLGVDEKDSVLNSVYDTMKHNYEVKLRQDLERLNVISDIRNKRNINEPIISNNMDYYKNHQFEIVNRKNPETFPLGFKNPPKLIPLTNAYAMKRRDDVYYDEDVG